MQEEIKEQTFVFSVLLKMLVVYYRAVSELLFMRFVSAFPIWNYRGTLSCKNSKV